jgi:2-polyprenyl-3-methyl-5-hydroxy-6-metoxy-1,4-benzoquinol methylase
MFNRMQTRDERPELMDDRTDGGAELRQALRHLRRLNRIFGASGPILYGVRRLWEAAGRPDRMDILDVGCGSGDLNRRLLRWSDDNKVQLRIMMVDVAEEACEEARALYMDEPRISVKQANLFDLSPLSADIVTASQFVHHFPNRELPRVVRQMLNASRWGVVISDLQRGWIPWLAVWLVTRMISKNRYIRHDGPLSVAKGFRMAEWEQLKREFMTEPFIVTWRPLFRYAAVVHKADPIDSPQVKPEWTMG